jgi:uncharacterized protein (DUF2062 family)
MSTPRALFHRFLWSPLLNQLKQGITPEKLAWSVALGIVLGVFPVLGSTTILCALAAWLAGLNQPAIQSINYFVYPLQILLLIPFYRFGEWLFSVPSLKISVDQVRIMIQASIPGAIKVLWVTTLHAMAAWCLVAPPIALVVFVVMVPVFRGALPRQAYPVDQARKKL